MPYAKKLIAAYIKNSEPDHRIVFLQNGFVPLLGKLHGDETGKWGRMNAQQMVEHLSVIFKVSTGGILFELITPRDQLPKFKEFLYSDKQFRENTRAPVLPEEPLDLRFLSMQEAIGELRDEVNAFFEFFKNDLLITTLHPVFGELNFEEWIQLHHKHVTHHLRQFDLIENRSTA